MQIKEALHIIIADPRLNNTRSKTRNLSLVGERCGDDLGLIWGHGITPLESRILLSYVTGFTQEYLIGHRDDILSSEHTEQFLELIVRRKKGEPIAYIIGKREFYGRDFKVTPDVLIPRADSETLIDAVLKEPLHNTSIQILELGVGSGCLLVTLLAEIPEARGFGVDISNKALEIAKQNADTLGVENRIELRMSNWFENIPDKYDIIISNPPYIHEDEKHLMALETLEYEPHLALFGGLQPYNILAANAHKFLKERGKIYVEIGVNQAIEVEKIFISEGYIVAGKHQDIEERARVLAFAIDSI
jgi:release factor glutamine methyltransferase